MRSVLAVASILATAAASHAAALEIDCPTKATVFDKCELNVALPPAFGTLPDTQVHDAYDADRDGRYVRLRAEFRHPTAGTFTVPGFAMRERFGGRWAWRIRWAPYQPGRWTVTVHLEGRAAPKSKAVSIVQRVKRPIGATVAPGIEGPLVPPVGKQDPRFLRRLRPDGGSRAIWLFGACRAWVVRSQDKHNDWFPHEWLDRETELFGPMREGGFNLLNQWMAPWEFLIVHHDRAEFWKAPGGKFKRRPLPKGAKWTPYQCLDQGRAAAFDALVTQCEGGPKKPPIRLLLSPLPHQCVQVKEHPWGSQESGWSPEDDAGKQTPERLNGFSGFRKKMSVWAFFEADPSTPLDDWRSQLFDHQANFYRYVIARWSYSRAVGVWVIIDELDAVGNVVGVMKDQKGWWGHPQCGRWLANIIRMFRGRLKRSDGLRYEGDPFDHPLHAATTSYGGQAGRGGNIDWNGGPADARPDLFGWHWYPSWGYGMTWSDVWGYTIDGVASYSKAPLGRVPRLISEFGAPDRSRPADSPSRVYPTLYHHAIWAAVFSGQAGTPMDWDDGKQFGELRWRKRKGIFDKKSYPIDHVEQLRALRRFLGDLSPDLLAPCSGAAAAVTCKAGKNARVYARRRRDRAGTVYGWLYCHGRAGAITFRGLRPGAYELAWYDTWSGKYIGGAANLRVDKAGTLALDPNPVLAKLRAAAKPFPAKSRLAQGDDVAFKLSGPRPLKE